MKDLPVGMAMVTRAARRPVAGVRTVSLLVAAVTVAVALAGCTVSGGARRAGQSGSPVVTKTALPTADGFTGIASVGGRLVLSGDGGGPGCRQTSAPVDPTRLTLGPVEATSCGRPNFAGQRASAELAYDPTNSTEMFSVAVRASRGRFTTGPVLATFAAPAGDHPVSTSADGSVWVWGTPVSGVGSQVTQISATSGAVLETVSLPRSEFGTPLMAADNDGLWLSLPPNTGPNASPTPIYFVPAGGRTVRVTELPARAGWWMVTEGHQVWIDTLTGAGVGEVLWTARGPGATLERLGSVAFPPTAEGGDDAAAGGTPGLWTFDRVVGADRARCTTTEALGVVRVVPGHAARPVATFEVPVTGCHAPLPEPGATVYRRGYLFVVDDDDLYKVRV